LRSIDKIAYAYDLSLYVAALPIFAEFIHKNKTDDVDYEQAKVDLEMTVTRFNLISSIWLL